MHAWRRAYTVIAILKGDGPRMSVTLLVSETYVCVKLERSFPSYKPYKRVKHEV